MTHSMFVPQEKLRQLSPKNNFSPKRPLVHLNFLNKMSEKAKGNNYKSNEKKDTSSREVGQ